MSRSDVLPLEVMRLASKTFAGDKGFSGPEITDFFRQHADDTPDYWELEAVPSRWVLFEDCLKRFPVAKQRQILLELCGWKGPMKWGRPEPDAIATLRRLLSEGIPVDEFETQLTRINAQTVQEDWRKILRRIPQDPDGAIWRQNPVLMAFLPSLTIIIPPTLPEAPISGVFLGIRVSKRPVLTRVKPPWRYVKYLHPENRPLKRVQNDLILA